LNPLKKLFKQTAIYGLATVLPRMLTFLLTPLYTGVLPAVEYGEISIIFACFAIFNVLLAYGMETAFFRFYTSEQNKEKVTATALISLTTSSIGFLFIAFLFQEKIAQFLSMPLKYVTYAIYILTLDALVIIPFAWLRANGKPIKYTLVKMVNVAINIGLNLLFLLVLPKLIGTTSASVFGWMYILDFEISYIFIAMIAASAVTFLWMLPIYRNINHQFDLVIWKKMMRYAWPVLVAGIAYTINEMGNRILLDKLLPEAIARVEVAKFSACIKLALFMTLFATAFRLGIEPFFFSHSKTENPQKAYAQITNYFIIFGSAILLTVVVFSDVLKVFIVQNKELWEAMTVVPILLLASFCLGIYHSLSVWYKITDRTKYGAYISTIGAVLTLIINIALIPIIGYMASAWATLAAYGSMMVLSYYFGKKHYPIPYNMRKITFYGGISIVFSILSFYVFNRNLIVGSLLLLVFLGLIYKLEGDKLKTILIRGEHQDNQ